MDSRNNPFTSKISQLCHRPNGRTLQTSLNYESSVSFFCCRRHQRSQPNFVSKGKKELMPFIFPSGSVPRWRFPATFQLHYRDLCRDYDKNTCFLQFQSDQGHFSPFSFLFFLCHHLSKLNMTGWSAFVQTADITCCQKSSGSKLSKSTTTCVFHHLPTHHVHETSCPSRTRHDDFLNLYWNCWMFSQVWLRL